MADTTQPAGALPEPKLLADFGVNMRVFGYTADQMRVLMAERDAVREDNEICREAIAHALSLVEAFASSPEGDDDMSQGAARATRRQLNEAIGKMRPRLMMERELSPKYGLRWKELREERDSLAAQVKQLAGAHVAWLDERDALHHRLVAVTIDRDIEKKIRKDYVDALEDMRLELEELRAQEPIGSTYTMQALAPGGHEVTHATFLRPVPRGTKLYARPVPPDAREGREPLTINQIREGYEGRSVIERAAFIAGVCHAEKLHGIGPVGTSADGEAQP